MFLRRELIPAGKLTVTVDCAGQRSGPWAQASCLRWPSQRKQSCGPQTPDAVVSRIRGK